MCPAGRSFLNMRDVALVSAVLTIIWPHSCCEAHMLPEVFLRHLFHNGRGSLQKLLTALLQDCGRIRCGLQNEGHISDGQVTGGGEEDDVAQLLLRPEAVEGFLLGAPHPELCQNI